MMDRDARPEEMLGLAAELVHESARYLVRVRTLLVDAYGLASSVWGSVPPSYLTVDYCDRMNEIYNRMHELGIEVEQ